MPNIDPGSRVALRDIIYFDFEKAASLFSQLEGGFLREVQLTLESTVATTSTTLAGAPPLQVSAADTASRRQTTLETRVIFHDLLERLETKLFEMEVVADLQEPADHDVLDPRRAIGDKPYVRAEGTGVFEDFERLKAIAERFNELTEFTATSAASDQLAADPAAVVLRQQIQSTAIQAFHAPEGKQKARLQSRLTELHIELAERNRVVAGLEAVPDWLVEGIKLWIDVFMSQRLTLRVQPFLSHPEFEVLANLKRECFFDSDFGHLRVTYGSRPTLPLTVVGLLASIPPAEQVTDVAEESPGPAAAPDARRSATDAPVAPSSEREVFERAFRELFPGIEGLEGMARFERFPSVTVYPLAVYRKIALASPPAPPSFWARIKKRVGISQ